MLFYFFLFFIHFRFGSVSDFASSLQQNPQSCFKWFINYLFIVFDLKFKLVCTDAGGHCVLAGLMGTVEP